MMNQCRGEYGYAFILVLFILLAIIGACGDSNMKPFIKPLEKEVFNFFIYYYLVC